jgi:hypothetical protein
MQAIVKESDVDDAMAELTRLRSTAPLEPDKEGFVDNLNEALRAAGSAKVVKVRLCVDLSVTINKFIEECPFQFPPVDELLEHLDPQGWLCKVDYRRCFFNIPLHPAMYKYIGLSWEETLWEATRVVFGITLGPHVASMFTGESALVCRGGRVPGSVYIDDNAITAPTEELCYARRGTALASMERAGWPIAEDKLESDRPSQRLAYRGVVFDTCEETLSIPLSRLEATHRLVLEVLDPSRAWIQVRTFRRLLGRLEWINQVLPVGRARTKRCYAVIPHRATNNWRMKLNPPARVDLQWWSAFLSSACTDGGLCQWTRFDVPLLGGAVVRIFSDASGEIGFGAVALHSVLVGVWESSKSVEGKSSGWKELIPVRLMLEHIAPTLEPGTLVVVTTDNIGNAFSINSGKASSPELFEQLLPIIELAAQSSLRLVADWVPREFNVLNDLLSRLSPLPGADQHAARDASRQEVLRGHEHRRSGGVRDKDPGVPSLV